MVNAMSQTGRTDGRTDVYSTKGVILQIVKNALNEERFVGRDACHIRF